MINKKHSNRIDLPPWPTVAETGSGVVLVSGKLRDPNIIEKRAQIIGLLVAVPLSLVLLLYAWTETPKNFFEGFSLKTIGIIVGIGIGVWFGFAIVWHLATCIIGRPVNNLFLFWLKSRVLVKFTSDAIEIQRSFSRLHRFDRKRDVAIEFHAAPHPVQAAAARSRSDTQSGGSAFGVSERFLDAFVVNFVYGGRVVHLLSTHTQAEANDFVTCLNWAAANAGAVGVSPSSRGTPAIAVDDRD